MPEPLQLAALLGGGFAAGFVNSVAGGGSLITFPLLIWLGFTPAVANGTNRVGLFFQNVASTSGYIQRGKRPFKYSLILAGPGLLSTILGAYLATITPPELLKKIFGVAIVLAGLAIFRGGMSREENEENLPDRPSWKAIVGVTLLGLYSGFIQVGSGLILIAILTLVDHLDIANANATKVIVILLNQVVALIVFASSGHVKLIAGLLLAVGTASGGWVGAWLGGKKGSFAWIRWVLLLMVFASAAKLFGLI